MPERLRLFSPRHVLTDPSGREIAWTGLMSARVQGREKLPRVLPRQNRRNSKMNDDGNWTEKEFAKSSRFSKEFRRVSMPKFISPVPNAIKKTVIFDEWKGVAISGPSGQISARDAIVRLKLNVPTGNRR
jgi:hypothetical protein